MTEFPHELHGAVLVVTDGNGWGGLVHMGFMVLLVAATGVVAEIVFRFRTTGVRHGFQEAPPRAVSTGGLEAGFTVHMK